MDKKEKAELKEEKRKMKQEIKERLVDEKKEGDTKQKVFYSLKVILILVLLICIGFVSGTIIQKNNYTIVNPVATIEIENYGTIKMELYPEYAPNTVANFIALANRGFYNNTSINRVQKDFVVQLGYQSRENQSTKTKLSDLKDDGADEEYVIKGEFIVNGFTQNTLKHTKGVVSMARADYSSYGENSITKKGYDSGSGQFFIVTKDNTNLDGLYAAFGKVTEGLDIVDQINNIEVETTDKNDEDETKTLNKPIDPPVVKSIRVETNGVDYGLPETMEPFDYYSYLMQQQYGSSY